MTRLLRVELQRYAARRLVRILGVLLLGVLATIVVVSFVQHDRDIAGARAKAERQAAKYGAGSDSLAQCEAEAAKQGVTPQDLHCQPVAADFFSDPRFRYVRQVTQFASAAAGVAIALSLIAAVGFIGAEWTAGTFASLLLWEPRRLRVMTAKLVVAAVTAALATLLAVTLLVLGAWFLGATRGTLAGSVGDATWRAVGTGLRGAGAAGVLATLFGGIAIVLRSTGGVLGSLALYTVAVENVLRALKPGWARWELGPNVAALVSGKVQLETTRDQVFTSEGVSATPFFDLHASRAGLYLTMLTAVVLLAAAGVLRRRDVT